MATVNEAIQFEREQSQEGIHIPEASLLETPLDVIKGINEASNMGVTPSFSDANEIAHRPAEGFNISVTQNLEQPVSKITPEDVRGAIVAGICGVTRTCEDECCDIGKIPKAKIRVNLINELRLNDPDFFNRPGADQLIRDRVNAIMAEQQNPKPDESRTQDTVDPGKKKKEEPTSEVTAVEPKKSVAKLPEAWTRTYTQEELEERKKQLEGTYSQGKKISSPDTVTPVADTKIEVPPVKLVKQNKTAAASMEAIDQEKPAGQVDKPLQDQTKSTESNKQPIIPDHIRELIEARRQKAENPVQFEPDPGKNDSKQMDVLEGQNSAQIQEKTKQSAESQPSTESKSVEKPVGISMQAVKKENVVSTQSEQKVTTEPQPANSTETSPAVKEVVKSSAKPKDSDEKKGQIPAVEHTAQTQTEQPITPVSQRRIERHQKRRPDKPKSDISVSSPQPAETSLPAQTTTETNQKPTIEAPGTSLSAEPSVSASQISEQPVNHTQYVEDIARKDYTVPERQQAVQTNTSAQETPPAIDTVSGTQPPDQTAAKPAIQSLENTIHIPVLEQIQQPERIVVSEAQSSSIAEAQITEETATNTLPAHNESPVGQPVTPEPAMPAQGETYVITAQPISEQPTAAIISERHDGQADQTIIPEKTPAETVIQLQRTPQPPEQITTIKPATETIVSQQATTETLFSFADIVDTTLQPLPIQQESSKPVKPTLQINEINEPVQTTNTAPQLTAIDHFVENNEEFAKEATTISEIAQTTSIHVQTDRIGTSQNEEHTEPQSLEQTIIDIDAITEKIPTIDITDDSTTEVFVSADVMDEIQVTEPIVVEYQDEVLVEQPEEIQTLIPAEETNFTQLLIELVNQESEALVIQTEQPETFDTQLPKKTPELFEEEPEIETESAESTEMVAEPVVEEQPEPLLFETIETSQQNITSELEPITEQITATSDNLLQVIQEIIMETEIKPVLILAIPENNEQVEMNEEGIELESSVELSEHNDEVQEVSQSEVSAESIDDHEIIEVKQQEIFTLQLLNNDQVFDFMNVIQDITDLLSFFHENHQQNDSFIEIDNLKEIDVTPEELKNDTFGKYDDTVIQTLWPIIQFMLFIQNMQLFIPQKQVHPQRQPLRVSGSDYSLNSQPLHEYAHA